MPHEEPVMPDEEPAAVSHQEPVTHDTAVQARQPAAHEPPAYEPVEEQDEWLEEPEELPRRPRRRLLGVGGNPIPLALLGVLLIACGFIGGVLIEKGQSSSSSSAGSATGFASRFRGLAGATSSTGTSSPSTGGALSSSGGFTRPTAGTVAYLSGSTLYVTNSEGNTIKIATSVGTSVTKSVKATVKGIHPGETVTVTGATAANGTVSAESISVGSSGGGLAALFGGSSSATGASSSGTSSSGTSSSGTSSSSTPALFGSGG